MVYGVWCMVYGVWCIEYGVWCMVYGVCCGWGPGVGFREEESGSRCPPANRAPRNPSAHGTSSCLTIYCVLFIIKYLWFPVYGLWLSVSGSWFIIYCLSFTFYCSQLRVPEELAARVPCPFKFRRAQHLFIVYQISFIIYYSSFIIYHSSFIIYWQ